MQRPSADLDERAAFLRFYDQALPHVYGYLSARCGGTSLAEDLTAETFLAAVAAVRRDDAPPVGLPWIMGVARHKLIDHWRRLAREQRSLQVLEDADGQADDPWEARLEAVAARRALATLPAQHQAALTLRYLDDLPVAAVAGLLGRTVHATEALLVRARASFRRAYSEEEGRDG